MTDILLSVKKPFSDLILSEEKKWELRKTEPRAMKDGSITLWLYESGKDGAHAIIGKCQTKYALPMLQQLDNWQRLWMMREACITEDYLAYLYVKNGGKRVRGMCVSASFAALMMGWPQKWTSLKPLAMGKYLLWRQLHSGFCSAES